MTTEQKIAFIADAVAKLYEGQIIVSTGNSRAILLKIQETLDGIASDK